MPTDFVHLHVHTEFSLLDGLCRIPRLMERVQELGQKAVAITDHGNMYGNLHFYNNALKTEGAVKPIIGCEFYLARTSRLEKQFRPGADQFHLTVLAKNARGYQNLLKLTTIANLEGFSYKPRLDLETLFKHGDDLIILSGCMSSLTNRLILEDKPEQALAIIKQYQERFGADYYFELQAHPNLPQQDKVNTQLVSWSRELDIPLVATNDVHYLTPADAVAQDAVLAVGTRKLVADTKRLSMLDSPDFYLRSGDEMAELFSSLPEALANTLAIAEQCNVEIERGHLHFPAFTTPKGETEQSYFDKLIAAGLKKKISTPTPAILERLAYEKDVITQKGYLNYFLITQDFVNWAKNQGIRVGPGRGSAAGSLVAYCLNITEINPIEQELPFERFLNPQRPTPPDIDMDFADVDRDKVIGYITQKYGYDRVAQMITFGKMEPRVAVRDIGRVLGFPYEVPDKIAKLIPNEPGKHIKIDQAIAQVPELKVYSEQPKYQQLFDLVRRVEGIARHSGVHASAVIVADASLDHYTAVQKDSKSGKLITQSDMYVLDCNVSDDAIGLLKFDFLGLRNLTTLQLALKNIKEQKGLDLDLSTIPMDDPKTFKLFQSGETMGVFQMESAGMRRSARNLKPTEFSDITALLALYRPGPMNLIPTFIEGKHHPDKIDYPHEALKSVLKVTYGVMVYQEQILQIANLMAGYTLGEADILRRAIGKKKKYLLDENHARFVQQSMDKGYSKEVAEKVWGFIEAFADYGFNKAHAASYAMISYQTAYLKANYPVEYMCAMMSAESASNSLNRDEKIAVAVDNCQAMGITLLPPDINSSFKDFSIEPKEGSLESMAIRFGLGAIKNVGGVAIDVILEVRQKDGLFTSFSEFLSRVDRRKVNKKTLESLIKIGAFSQFANIATLMSNYETARAAVESMSNTIDGQDNLFADTDEQQQSLNDSFNIISEYPEAEILTYQKELLGFYLNNHPLALALAQVQDQAEAKLGDLDAQIHPNQTLTFGGIISDARVIQTKKGADMAFAKFSDNTGKVELIIFPKVWETIAPKMLSTPGEDVVGLVRAKVSYEDEEFKLLAERISLVDQSALERQSDLNSREIFIPQDTPKDTLKKLGDLLKAHPGGEKVTVIIPSVSGLKRLLLPYTIKWSESLEKKIKEILGLQS